MYKFKQIANNVCGFLQILYGFALIVLSFMLLAKWFFNDDALFLPSALQYLTTLFNNETVAKILPPVLGLAVGGIDIALAFLLLKSTAQKPLGVVAFFSALINLVTTIVFCWWFTADETKNTAILFAILTGVVAVIELVSAFHHTDPTAAATQVQQQPQIPPQAPTQTQAPIQTQTAQPPLQVANTAPTTQISDEKNLQDFKQRSAELFRLAKNGNISQENLDYCLQWLMEQPLEQPFSLKINHLNKFTSNGMLTRPVISQLICKAIICYNTSPLKKRIYFLEQMHSQNAVTEEDYSDAIRKLMADGNATHHDVH